MRKGILNIVYIAQGIETIEILESPSFHITEGAKKDQN